MHSFFGYASALSWFAVHPVSMNNTNRMVSSDNLGYASYAFEQEKNIGFLPGQVKDYPFNYSLSLWAPSSRLIHCLY